MSTGAATAGRAATSEGQQGLSPPPLDLRWFLLPLLALGFPDGYEACPAPLPWAPHSRLPTGLGWGQPLSCPLGLGGPAAMEAPQPPLMPPGTRSWVPSPPEATLASPDHLCPPFCLAFFLPCPSPPSPQLQNNFPLYKQNSSLVRKQYRFRSKD